MTDGVAASVHQKLLNRARAEARPFNELLQYFALERFLYRLGCSPYRHQFVLKGALMFTAWQTPLFRPTRDIDLLGRLDNDVEHIITVVKEICEQPVPEDGLNFVAETVVGEQITEAANYQGVRVKFIAHLGTARIRMQIDIGFGDAVVPGPSVVCFPTLLDFPPSELQGYSRESAIAEKLHSMVRLGEINSRIKDFFDIWLLAARFSFEGKSLTQAIRETFHRRQTEIPEFPIAFDVRFTQNANNQSQWKAFVQRHRFSEVEAIPATLHEAVQLIAAFLQPALQALIEEHHFNQVWPPGGPWSPLDLQEEA